MLVYACSCGILRSAEMLLLNFLHHPIAPFELGSRSYLGLCCGEVEDDVIRLLDLLDIAFPEPMGLFYYLR